MVAEDIQSAYETLKGRGIDFTLAPTAAPWNAEETYALFCDSEGNTVMIGSH